MSRFSIDGGTATICYRGSFDSISGVCLCQSNESLECAFCHIWDICTRPSTCRSRRPLRNRRRGSLLAFHASWTRFVYPMTYSITPLKDEITYKRNGRPHTKRDRPGIAVKGSGSGWVLSCSPRRAIMHPFGRQPPSSSLDYGFPRHPI